MAQFDPIMWEQVGGVKMAYRWPLKNKLKILERKILDTLPGAWAGRMLKAKANAEEQLKYLGGMIDKYSGAVAANLSEQGIRDRAKKLVAMAVAACFVERQRLVDWVIEKGARPKGDYSFEQLYARVKCEVWWRRQLRRAAAQLYERGSYELGLVGAAVGQWYCSNGAVVRRGQQNKANEAAMRARVIERRDGVQMTVWDAAQTTVSNKSIRRAELMTRISGAERWAERGGLVGLFTTQTCPSRYHSQRKGGGANPNYDGSSPGDAQAWLTGVWARLRAKWAREGVRVMGYRVAEPHHDGCPHWHMLIWCAPADVERVEQSMRRAWLKDAGAEPGAAEYRVNIKPMLPGMAAGYMAKYVSKNIDDQYTAAHVDEQAPGVEVGPDLVGGQQVKPCQRVEAWAATWRIRQFQAFGQPPVTVWRELRRVDKQGIQGASLGVAKAWMAVHRTYKHKASWDEYMDAQGGAMMPRAAQVVGVAVIEREVKGKYGPVAQRWACGIVDMQARAAGEELFEHPNTRQRWGREGFARSAGPASPWTRLNNCTHTRKKTYSSLDDANNLAKAGVLQHSWPDTAPCSWAYMEGLK